MPPGNDGQKTILKPPSSLPKRRLGSDSQEVAKIKDNRQQPQLTWDANMKVGTRPLQTAMCCGIPLAAAGLAIAGGGPGAGH